MWQGLFELLERENWAEMRKRRLWARSEPWRMGNWGELRNRWWFGDCVLYDVIVESWDFEWLLVGNA